MILDRIVSARREDVRRAAQAVGRAELEKAPLFAEPRRGFARALAAQSRSIIAEVKKASPSRGLIRAEFDPAWIAGCYASSGAAAVSVLTEHRHFQGVLADLAAVRRAVALPLLRKDFIFDSYQVVEARAWGADAILLIVACLTDDELRDLAGLARSLELDVLVEVHTREELLRALGAGAALIGVNNRDLRTFETSLQTSIELAAEMPGGVHRVAESGIHTPADLQLLEAAGYTTFLVGESLMRAGDPGDALRSLLAKSAAAPRGPAG